MTSPPNVEKPELLAVIQEDREAAAQIVEWQIGTGWEPPFFSAAFPAAIRVGTWDEHDLVQAFARHRLDTRPTPAAVGDVEAELKSWQRDCRQEATRANRAEDRFLRAEAVLKSIAANSCCDKCQEAARVAQTYFDAALAQPQPSGGVDEAQALLLELTEISGDKAAAFTLREVGIVGTVFEQQAAAIQRALLGKGGQD